MADLRFESPKTTEAFCESLAKQNVTLPVDHDAGFTGSIVDANGVGLAVVDPDNQRPDAEAMQIADLIIVALNTCGGFKAEITA